MAGPAVVSRWQTRVTNMVPTRWLSAFSVLVGVLAPAAIAAPAPDPPTAEEPSRGAEAARLLWQRGYFLHELGLFKAAIRQYRLSIAIEPTAEAHTFLGWSLSHLGALEEAIKQCKTAIEIDPGFGNPYNDIGVYLIDLGRAAEAIPWFDKAIASKRYCCYQFPHFNKGRVLLKQDKLEAASRSLQRALEHDPNYVPAREMLRRLREEHGQPL